MCRKEWNETSSRVFWRSLHDISNQEALLMLPQMNSLKRQVNRIQSRCQSPNPTSSHEIEISEVHKVTTCGELFLMHNSGAQDNIRILIYTTWTIVFVLCSVAESCLTLGPHGLQHARLCCPSSSLRVCSNPCPLSRWCHPIIPSSVAPFFSCPQSLPASGSFPRIGSLHQVAKVLALQLQHQSYPRVLRVDFL